MNRITWVIEANWIGRKGGVGCYLENRKVAQKENESDSFWLHKVSDYMSNSKSRVWKSRKNERFTRYTPIKNAQYRVITQKYISLEVWVSGYSSQQMTLRFLTNEHMKLMQPEVRQ